MKAEIYQNYKFNIIVNVIDGGFFGLALGFASFITVIPLFVSRMTDSAILIGLIPAIHQVGWQLPQVFFAERVGRLTRYKPMVVALTIHERLPFLGLALVAFAVPVLGIKAALYITFALLVWQGIGGGITANPWQAMIAKIIPSDRRGTFYGFQAAMANLLASGSAIAAGVLLTRLEYPRNYALCFLIAGLAMLISLVFIAMTREPESPPAQAFPEKSALWKNLIRILKADTSFRWFLVVRGLSQLSVMAVSFYTVYAVRNLGMNEAVAGLMMSVFTFGQIIANPLMGWIGDRWNHPTVMKVGALSATLSALLAWWAPSLNWFYLVFIFAGIAYVAIWTIGLAMTLQFGSEPDRPFYIGLANTLAAPFTIAAPLFGGWLADTAGYASTFLVSALCGLGTALVLQFTFTKPIQKLEEEPETSYGN